MKKVFCFVSIILTLSIGFSCQKKYSCQCETINALYNPDNGVKEVHNVYAKNKGKATENCEAISEKWGDVVTTCKLQ